MSRPTDLQLRTPKDIIQSIYQPMVTYEGKQLQYKPRRFSGHRQVFLVGEERFRITKIELNQSNPFTGP